MYHISATKRCHLFEEIADDIWRRVIHNHQAAMNVSEIGITADIIATIRNHANRIPNFGVWANPGYNESVNGSDIDIFVETTLGNFIWFALQAKALRNNGSYHDMAGIRNGEYQWEKLERLERQAGCIAKYLLYNGVKEYKHFGIDQCNGGFNEDQFGCSIVDKDKVASVAVQRNPTFYDFHPNDAQPWRIIVCCMHDTTKNTLFNISQVKKAVDYYPVAFGNTNVLQVGNTGQKQNEFADNVINDLSEINGRTPYYRVVVRTTDALMHG